MPVLFSTIESPEAHMCYTYTTPRAICVSDYTQVASLLAPQRCLSCLVHVLFSFLAPGVTTK